VPTGKTDYLRSRVLQSVLGISQDVPTVTFNADPPRSVGAEWEIYGDSRELLAPGWQLISGHGSVILLVIEIEFDPKFQVLPSDHAQTRRLQELGHKSFRAWVRRIPEELPEPEPPRRTAWEWITSWISSEDEDSV
jgi:hypothetical protein